MTRTFRARLGLVILASVTAAAAVGTPAAAAARGTVQGTYTTDAGAPIADAYVSAFTPDFGWLADGNTDARGRFTLRNVNSGEFRLQFHSNGIEQWAHRATGFESATTFALADGQTLTVDERQLPTGTIAGTVHEPTGEPASWFAAVIERRDETGGFGGAAYAYPDETGRYALDLLPGEYRVRFERDATRQWAYGKDTAAAADTFVVRAGETTTVDDTFLPTGSLGGRLSTADGGPMVEAEVNLHQPEDPESVVSYAFTDENGNYTFGGALPGRYLVSFIDQGRRQWIHETSDPAAATPFVVTAGEHTVADDRPLRPGRLHGTLVDTEGAGMAGMTVRARLASDPWGDGASTTTGADGSWDFPRLDPAIYLVSFVNAEETRTESAAPITLASNGTVTVDHVWPPGASLTVRAVDAGTGAPAADFCVWVHEAEADQCTPDGELTLTDLPVGTFPVSVSPSERSFYLDPWDSQDATLTAGGHTTLTFALTKGGKVTTTIVDAAGAPVRHACIQLVRPGSGGLGDGRSGECSNAAGKVTTQALAAGSYQAYVFAPEGLGDQWVGATGGAGDQREAVRITVRAGKVTNAVGVRLDPPGSIAGTVTDPSGAPVPYANVAYSAWGYGVGGSHDVEADEQGRYTIGGLGPYAWPLVFTTEAGPRQWSGGTGNRFQAELIPVPAGGVATYDMRLAAGTTLTGQATIRDGVPADRWRLTVVNAVTGDQMGVLDSSAAPGGAYTLPLIGGQQVKLAWDISDEEAFHQSGWHDNATDRETATKIAIPKWAPKRLDLTLGRA